MRNLTKVETILQKLSILNKRISDIGYLTNGLNDFGFTMASHLRWKLEDYEYDMTINDIYDRRTKEIKHLTDMLPSLLRDEKINQILS